MQLHIDDVNPLSLEACLLEAQVGATAILQRVTSPG